MATSSTRTQARKTTAKAGNTTRAAGSTAKKATRGTKRAARSTQQAARATRGAAEATGREATSTAQEAQRTLGTLVRDGAYAALGVGDSTVEVLRHATTRAGTLGRNAPQAVQAVGPRARHLADAAPAELRSTVTGLLTSAGETFDGYARRGRSVVGAISRGRATGRATEQLRNARSQVKAASTSVGKAVDETVDAAESAAGKVGVEGRGQR